MCGILGRIDYSSWAPADAACLRRPLDLMLHRGPDDEGTMADGPCAMGMRRLRIIDLEGGRQPMANEDGSVSVVFNGEIYNYRELRRDLERRHRFRTRSDTEVIVHLYEEHGAGCLAKLNGMFAIALWDAGKGELLLARDRAGVKPLFYGESGGTLYFSSEIRSLLAFGALSKDTDPQALAEYLSFYYVSEPRTIYKEIRRVPLGGFMRIYRGKIETGRFHSYRFRPDYMPEAEAAELLEKTLLASVKRQLMSDVPLGVFLSSGLDSTAIVAMMAKLGARAKTYTVGFEDGGTYNELAGARIVARKYGTEHRDCILKPSDLAESLPRVISHLSEPHGDWTHVAMHHVSKASRPDITVALTGAGGDELFGGYPTLTAASLARLYRALPSPVRNVLESGAKKLPTSYERMSFDFKAKSFIRGAGHPPEIGHLKYKEIFSPEEITELLGPGAPNDAFPVYARLLPEVEAEPMLNRLMYLDLNVFLPYCSLHATDMATMMNSQEARVPFLDGEMMALSERIPPSLKLKGFTTKYIARRALRKYLPDEILKMPKKGFVLPSGKWLRGELNGFMHEIIGESEKSSQKLFNFNYIRRLAAEHEQGKADHTRRLTCLLSLLIWESQRNAPRL